MWAPEEHPISSLATAARSCMSIALVALLVGCASRGPVPPPAASLAPEVNEGRPATIAAIREVEISPGDGSLAGVDGVLAALSQSPPGGRISLQEVVINQPGNIPASIGGAYSGLAAGQRVAITAGQTLLLRPED